MFKFGEILEKIPKKYVGTGKRTNIGEAARLGEIRLGQILKNISKKDSYTGFGQRSPVLPKGITKKQSHYSQELNRNEQTFWKNFQKVMRFIHINKQVRTLT